MSTGSLKGKVALITGGSTGIGRASAEVLAKRGAKVVINYLRSVESDQEAKTTIEKNGGECILVQADVTQKADVEKLVQAGLDAFGQIDILVNNAGAALKRSAFLDIDEALWDATFALNVKSILLVSQAVLKHMVPKKNGKIINISSVAARLGGPGESIHYASAKGAVSTMTVGMAREFAPHGILVNGIAPGLILTPFQEKYSTSERIDRIIASTPVQRAGTAEEVAELVAYLSSDAANFISGEIITISGGR